MSEWKARVAELVGRLTLLCDPYPAVIDTPPYKTRLPEREPSDLCRPIVLPYGADPASLCELLRALEREERANVRAITVLKAGEQVLLATAPGYDEDVPYLAHSMAKTLVGMLVGVLADDALLDVEQPVQAFFPEYRFRDPRGARMTVEHLLTMRSGIPLSEAGSVSELYWTEAIFSDALTHAPGERFAYNSMNTYLLGRIVERVGGMSLGALAERRIFAPLGICSYLWEKSPEGYEKAGWGLYLTLTSWAKLGQLIAENGSYEGRRVLSRAWVERMTEPHAKTPPDAGDFDYGYHLWVGREHHEILFNGMLGQNVWILPESRTVVAMLAGNNELFARSTALTLVREHFLHGERGIETRGTPPMKVPPILHRREEVRARRALAQKEQTFFRTREKVLPLERARGLGVLVGLASREPYPAQWDALLGDWRLADNNASLLPLLVRVMQNNYTGGIRRISLVREGDALFLCVTEGTDAYRIAVGLYAYRSSVVHLGGEVYRVAALGRAEIVNAATVAHLTLVFPELPNTRDVTLTLAPDGRLTLTLTEMPKEEIASAFFASGEDRSLRAELLSRLLGWRYGADFLDRLRKEVFSPTLIGVREGVRGSDATLAEENAAVAQKKRERTPLYELLVHATRDRAGKKSPAEPTRSSDKSAQTRRAHSPPERQKKNAPVSRGNNQEDLSPKSSKGNCPPHNKGGEEENRAYLKERLSSTLERVRALWRRITGDDTEND